MKKERTPFAVQNRLWGCIGERGHHEREDGESMSKVISVTEMFGKDVFNDAVMRDRLPKSVYKKLKKTIEDGAETGSQYCRCGSIML